MIKTIDADGRGVTIEHEANESLDVEAGTTHYPVSDPRILTDLGPGAEVDYDIDVGPGGALVVTDLVEMGR